MSSLSIGIVGLPNVGKSTLFNALTDNDALAANYPFATIEPNTGIVPIPDSRLEKLASLYTRRGPGLDGVQGAAEQQTESYMQYGEGAAQAATQQSAKSSGGVVSSAGQQANAARPRIVPATVTFVDIAGLVAGAHKGEGLGNQFLGNIRSCAAIAHVVRAFEDSNVQHVDDEHEPAKDIDVINTELVLADLQTIERHKPKLEKEAKTDPKKKLLLGDLERIHVLLDAGKPLFAHPEELALLPLELLQELQLLTAKPVIYVFNVDEATLADTSKQATLRELVTPSTAIFVSAKLEDELRSLNEAERAELLESYGVETSGLEQLTRAAYEALGLQSYLTAGDKEVRAWTIHRGMTAPQAAGVIHGDFERGFIAAEVVSYDDLVAAGSRVAAKAAGKVRTEGKTYIVEEDDVIEFRFNV